MVTRSPPVRRGEVWLVALDPTLGSEIQKTRPAVVVSPDEMNLALRTVVVAPMTSKGWSAPFRIPILFAGQQGLVVLDQLRTVDRQRLVRRLGEAPPEALAAALSALSEMFAP